MKKMHSTFFLIFCLFSLLLLPGCYKSYDVFYTANAPLAPNSLSLQKYTIGIAKFEDKRTFPVNGVKDLKDESFVAKEGGKKRGCTYKNNDYTPVKDIVQDILVQEFNMAGLKAIPLDIVISKDNMQNVKDLQKMKAVDFVLGGQLLVIKFNQGFVGQREDTVAVNLNIFNKNGLKLINDQYVDQKNISPPKLFHAPFTDPLATFANDLVNETFRKAAHQIVSITAKTITEASAQK